MLADWAKGLMGGVLIGTSVSLMLLWTGRVTGISGILNGALTYNRGDWAWRFFFILGLFFGGILTQGFEPKVFSGALEQPLYFTAMAGLLVGFGTVMGSGCTSGHGVCGLSRLSIRSLAATLTFMVAGVFSVLVFRWLGVHP